MNWLEYIVRRLVMAVAVLISVSIITFVIARIVPSDPAAAWVGPRPSPEQIEKARIDLGLDRPLYIQYLRYMDGLVHGNLGTSVKSHQPIANDLRTYLPATLELVVVGMLMACVLGIPLGVLSGWKKGSLVDHLSRVMSVAGVSIPTFRMTRSTMIAVLNERYILAARVFGIPERTILFVLALKNAIVPTLVVLGLAFVYSLTGAILVEVIFSWPGLGSYMTAAVINVDFPVIVSVTLIVTVFYVMVNLVLDLIQAAIDPRVALQ
jgi:peptide/nickel transport system permease protein